MEAARLQPTKVIVEDERGKLDIPFLLLVLLLLTIGVIMLFSASYARSYVETGNSTFYFARQAKFALAGVAAMMFVSYLNYQWWRILSAPVMGVAVLLMILVVFMGSSGGGAQRWIELGPVRFQPSEVTKFAVVICFATIISGYKDKMQSFRYGVLPFAVILAVIAGLLVLQKHLSATLIILATGAIMMFLGGTRMKWFGILGVVAVGAVLLYINTMGYASERIVNWRNPFADPSDGGLQIVQSLYAIGSGGMMGLGFGKSRQKYLYLPEEHNDYIFSIVCEELGFVGATLIILLFVLLIVRGYWIAMHAHDRFGTLVAGGLTTLLMLQVFLNIGVVTNFLPSTGISLPFFSYGGTALMIQLFEMGIILNISRSNKQNIV